MDKFEKEILRITRPTFILILCYAIVEYFSDITSRFYFTLHFFQLCLVPILYLIAQKAPGALTKVILGYFIIGLGINAFFNEHIALVFLFTNLYCHTPVLFLLHKWEIRIYFLMCSLLTGILMYNTIPDQFHYAYPFTFFAFMWIYHQTLRNRTILINNVVYKEMSEMAAQANHSINNPLHVVNTVLKRFEKKETSEKDKTDIKKARVNLKRIENYVKELHDLDDSA